MQRATVMYKDSEDDLGPKCIAQVTSLDGTFVTPEPRPMNLTLNWTESCDIHNAIRQRFTTLRYTLRNTTVSI